MPGVQVGEGAQLMQLLGQEVEEVMAAVSAVKRRSSPYFPRCGRELWLCLTGHLGKSQVR